jgi:hypothetical protein
MLRDILTYYSVDIREESGVDQLKVQKSKEMVEKFYIRYLLSRHCIAWVCDQIVYIFVTAEAEEEPEEPVCWLSVVELGGMVCQFCS